MADPLNDSTYNTKNGRYSLGGTTEVSSRALEWWERKNLPKDESDLVYIMEKKYEGRPDLLGLLFYGDPGLWWVIGQYNGLVDPLGELIEGKLLYIPMIERVRAQLINTATIGGVQSTRT